MTDKKKKQKVAMVKCKHNAYHKTFKRRMRVCGRNVALGLPTEKSNHLILLPNDISQFDVDEHLTSK